MLGTVSFELYKFAIARPGWTRADASDALGYTMREIDAAVADLSDKKLLQQPADDADLYVAMSPDIALSELVDEDERHLQDLRSTITNRRRQFSSLVPVYHEARQQLGYDSSVEVLEDATKIQRLIVDYGRDVSDQVLIAQPGQGYNADVHEESIKKDLALLASGVTRKNIYHDSTRDHVPTRKAVAALSPAGAEHRTLPHVPIRMMVFDQNLVVLSRPPDTGPGALVVRDTNLIKIFTNLFHSAWEFASPYPVEDEPSPSKLSSIQESILKGMASGHGDEAIARRLDINVRTCRRHIAWMLEELGANSRFQAAIKAREAGWI